MSGDLVWSKAELMAEIDRLRAEALKWEATSARSCDGCAFYDSITSMHGRCRAEEVPHQPLWLGAGGRTGIRVNADHGCKSWRQR